MQRIDTEILIAALPRDVWATLCDLSDYADWNPWIQDARGDAMVGRNLSLSFFWRGKLRHRWGLVTRADAPKVLRWTIALLPMRLIKAEFRFRLRQRSRGGTVLYHSVVFSGPLEIFFSSLLRTSFVDGATATNRALKRRVERRCGDSDS